MRRVTVVQSQAVLDGELEELFGYVKEPVHLAWCRSISDELEKTYPVGGIAEIFNKFLVE
jgi:hypothetical protein